MHRNYDEEFYLRVHEEDEQQILAQQKLRKNKKASKKKRCDDINESERDYEL